VKNNFTRRLDAMFDSLSTMRAMPQVGNKPSIDGERTHCGSVLATMACRDNQSSLRSELSDILDYCFLIDRLICGCTER